MKLNELVNRHLANDLKIDLGELNQFYQKYINTFSECTEASAKFILTVLFTALGSAISVNRWIEWGTKRIYPNFWVIILGESTRSRKTTALDIGLYLVKNMEKANSFRDYLLPSRSSISSLIDILEYEKNGVIEHSELATFLELLKKGFNCDMKSLLTSFFDVPPSYKVNFITKEEKNLCYPIFSIATASTPIWLEQNLKKGDSTSGFLARFLFAFQNKKSKTIAIPQAPDPEKIKELDDVFQSLYRYEPLPISLGKEFEQIYTEFYHESDELIDCLPYDSSLKSIFSRLQTDYFMKFLILECALAEKNRASNIEVNRARYLVSFYMAQAIATIKEITSVKAVLMENRIMDCIEQRGKATRTDLYRHFKNRITASRLNAILTSLERAEQVESIASDDSKAVSFRLKQ
jgi:hypothetical protein